MNTRRGLGVELTELKKSHQFARSKTPTDFLLIYFFDFGFEKEENFLFEARYWVAPCRLKDRLMHGVTLGCLSSCLHMSIDVWTPPPNPGNFNNFHFYIYFSHHFWMFHAILSSCVFTSEFFPPFAIFGISGCLHPAVGEARCDTMLPTHSSFFLHNWHVTEERSDHDGGAEGWWKSEGGWNALRALCSFPRRMLVPAVANPGNQSKEGLFQLIKGPWFWKREPHQRCWCSAGSRKSAGCWHMYYVLQAEFAWNIFVFPGMFVTPKIWKMPNPEGIKQLNVYRINLENNTPRNRCSQKKGKYRNDIFLDSKEKETHWKWKDLSKEKEKQNVCFARNGICHLLWCNVVVVLSSQWCFSFGKHVFRVCGIQGMHRRIYRWR